MSGLPEVPRGRERTPPSYGSLTWNLNPTPEGFRFHHITIEKDNTSRPGFVEERNKQGTEPKLRPLRLVGLLERLKSL